MIHNFQILNVFCWGYLLIKQKWISFTHSHTHKRKKQLLIGLSSSHKVLCSVELLRIYSSLRPSTPATSIWLTPAAKWNHITFQVGGRKQMMYLNWQQSCLLLGHFKRKTEHLVYESKKNQIFQLKPDFVRVFTCEENSFKQCVEFSFSFPFLSFPFFFFLPSLEVKWYKLAWLVHE